MSCPRSLLNKGVRWEGCGGEEGSQGGLAAVTSPCGVDNELALLAVTSVFLVGAGR
jgi:hypothetical protein